MFYFKPNDCDFITCKNVRLLLDLMHLFSCILQCSIKCSHALVYIYQSSSICIIKLTNNQYNLEDTSCCFVISDYNNYNNTMFLFQRELLIFKRLLKHLIHKVNELKKCVIWSKRNVILS